MQVNNGGLVFPDLTPSSRFKEYDDHKEFKDQIVYEYLFNSKSHRWLDENILRLDYKKSLGYQSMGVLHYLGIKGVHKGFFSNSNIEEAINILQSQDGKFDTIIDCLTDKLEDERNEGQNIIIEVNETEQDLIMKSRIGQNKFKDALLNISEKCKLCETNDRKFLIASHIKPWHVSTHEERLDVNNGFLLCPNHDWVFDKGYISFDSSGLILLSNLLSDHLLNSLNIDRNMNISLNEQQEKYMFWHRENVFKNNKKRE